jgi:hypothetical protein
MISILISLLTQPHSFQFSRGDPEKGIRRDSRCFLKSETVIVKKQTQNWVFNVFNIMIKIIEDVDVDSGKYNKAQKSLETSVLNIPSVSGLYAACAYEPFALRFLGCASSQLTTNRKA